MINVLWKTNLRDSGISNMILHTYYSPLVRGGSEICDVDLIRGCRLSLLCLCQIRHILNILTQLTAPHIYYIKYNMYNIIIICMNHYYHY